MYILDKIQGHVCAVQDGQLIPGTGCRRVLWGQRGQNEDQLVEVMERISTQF